MTLRTPLPHGSQANPNQARCSLTRCPVKAVGVLGALACLLALVTATSTAQAAVTGTNPVGVVCTEEPGSTTPTFDMTVKTGYILLPDANTMFMWGFSEGAGGFQHPSPTLCVNEGDQVTVILSNPATFAENVSIMFPGQTDVLADGQPVGPEIAANGRIDSLTNSAAPGATVTYTFTAGEPGTYLYQSGTDSKKQVRMGLFGALIVRPAAGAGFANNRPDSQFMTDEEFLVLMSEIDPFLNQAVERGRYSSYDWNNYQARYWLINGRGFPDSIADNFSTLLPNQPYGALAAITEYTGAGGDHPHPGLARYVNATTETMPMHPHGNNGLVVNRDGQAYEGPLGEDMSFERFAINMGPGQTWDFLFQWQDPESYSPSNPVPVQIPNMQNQEVGVFYSGSPYLGETEALPTGTSTLNQCGEFYIVSHNHALHQIVSWGANMTGPITYMRINPATAACDI